MFQFSLLIIFQSYFFSKGINSKQIEFIVLDCFILIFAYAFRGYDLDQMRNINSLIVSYLLAAVFSGLVISVVSIFIIDFEGFYNKVEIAISLIVSILVFPILVRSYYSVIKSAITPNSCYILGSEERFGALLEEIESSSHGLMVVKEWITDLSSLPPMTSQQSNNLLLIADWSLFKEYENEIQKLQYRGTHIKFLTTACERWLKRIPLNLLDEFSDYYEMVFSSVEETIEKRLLDIFISAIGLIVLSPLIILMSCLVFLLSGYPIIFKQERVGIYGKNFTMNKFRSMKRTSEKNGSKYAVDQKHKITLIGKIMRPFRIDEIPQFFDILRSKMSLIGPRPEQPAFVEDLAREIPSYHYRLVLKPGITGWAQIHYQYASTLEEQKKKLSYDLYYVKNRSLNLDLTILLMTFETIIFKRGAI